MLQIEHPILLAGMGGVAYAELAAAVSNAGGYGVLGMAGLGPEQIRDQMRKTRKLTDRPFGVDLLAASPESLTSSVDVIINEGATAFIAGLGVPMPILERLHNAGLKVMVVCGQVKHAIKAEQAGCDAVICQGGEGGGHTGLVGTFPLVAQAVETVKIPVAAAGGLYDGRGLAGALALGAQAVWLGTRFIATPEAHAGDLYREAVVGARDEDTVRTRCYSGKPMRVRANPYVADWETRPQDIQPFPAQAIMSTQTGVIGGIGGQLEGLDPDRSCFAMGQSAGGVHKVKPAAELVAEIMADAHASIARLAKLDAASPAG
jgi:enoyl-[acyl-carrier protein] reductase II